MGECVREAIEAPSVNGRPLMTAWNQTTVFQLLLLVFRYLRTTHSSRTL
jgi:hypothetical protein